MNDNNKSANKKLNKAIEAFGDQWPEAYRLLLQEKKLFNGDIFFIPEVENPSELQLKAAKIIKSNQMIDALSNAVLVEVTAGKNLKKLIKNNMTDLLSVLKCSTEFLLTQFEAPKLEILLINLLRVGSHQGEDQLVSKVIPHLCGEELAVKQSKKDFTELMLISVLAATSSDNRSLILNSSFSKSSKLLSLLSSLSTQSDSFVTNLKEKLVVLLEPGHLELILNNNCLLHNMDLVTFILDMSTKLIERSNGFVEQVSRMVMMVMLKLQTFKTESA